MGTDSGITIQIPPTVLISIMDRTTRTVDDFSTDDQMNSLTGTMEIDRIMGISIFKVELGETMGIFLVHPQDKDGTALKVILSVNLNLSNL